MIRLSLDMITLTLSFSLHSRAETCPKTELRAFAAMDNDASGQPTETERQTQITAATNILNGGRATDRQRQRFDIDENGALNPRDILIMINLHQRLSKRNLTQGCTLALFHAFSYLSGRPKSDHKISRETYEGVLNNLETQIRNQAKELFPHILIFDFNKDKRISRNDIELVQQAFRLQ